MHSSLVLNPITKTGTLQKNTPGHESDGLSAISPGVDYGLIFAA